MAGGGGEEEREGEDEEVGEGESGGKEIIKNGFSSGNQPRTCGREVRTRIKGRD